jgi:hypothetical protein
MWFFAGARSKVIGRHESKARIEIACLTSYSFAAILVSAMTAMFAAFY